MINPGIKVAAVGAGAAALSIATAGRGSPAGGQGESRRLADAEQLHPGLLYGGRIVSRISAATDRLAEACARLGVVEVTTPARSFGSAVLQDNQVEVRFRLRVLRDVTAQDARVSLARAAFDAGVSPTSAEVWVIFDQASAGGSTVLGSLGDAAERAAEAAAEGARGVKRTIDLYVVLGIVLAVAAAAYLLRRPA